MSVSNIPVPPAVLQTIVELESVRGVRSDASTREQAMEAEIDWYKAKMRSLTEERDHASMAVLVRMN